MYINVSILALGSFKKNFAFDMGQRYVKIGSRGRERGRIILI